MWIGNGSTGNGWVGPSTVGTIDTFIFQSGAGNYMEGVGGDFPRQWLSVSSHQAYRNASQDTLEAMVEKGEDWRADVVNAGWDTLYDAAGAISTEEATTEAYIHVNLAGELGDYAWSGNICGRYVNTDTDASGTITTIDY